MTSAKNLRGIGLMAGAMAPFAFEDMFVKFAAQDLPTGQILLMTCLVGMNFFGILARIEGLRSLTRPALNPWVMLRNLGEMVGTYGYITALAVVPLATVSAVLQAMPLVVIRPGLDGFQPAALWVLVAVLGLGLRDLASRAVPPTISSTQLSVWGVASVAVLGAGMMPFQAAVMPGLWQAAMLLGAICFGTAGYWVITQASRTGEVSVVSPFRYSRLIFAIVIGLVVFGEPADVMTLCGAAVIIGSGLFSFARERNRKRALSTAAAAE